MSDSQSWYPDSSGEREERVKEEAARLHSSVAVIDDVLRWFDSQIDELRNPVIITGVTDRTPAEDVKSQVLNAQKLIHDYKQRRDDFRVQFSKHIKETPIEQ